NRISNWAMPRSRRHRALDDNSGDHRTSDRVQQREELLQLVEPGIGDVDDIFVLDGKALCEKIRVGVAEIEAVDDGGAASGAGGQSARLESIDNIRRLESKKKPPGRICTQILQPSGLG